MPFSTKKIVYLEPKCSFEGAKPDPQKVKCVQKFLQPKTVHVHSFLGLANY